MSWIKQDKKIVNVTEMMDFITPCQFQLFAFFAIVSIFFLNVCSRGSTS
jgi:uncharacterized membrane protein